MRLPAISTSPSASIFLRKACAIFFSNFLAFFLLRGALGPLVGIRPGRAPRMESTFEILFLFSSDLFWRTLLALLAWAASLFLERWFGVLTDGIVEVVVCRDSDGDGEEEL